MFLFLPECTVLPGWLESLPVNHRKDAGIFVCYYIFHYLCTPFNKTGFK